MIYFCSQKNRRAAVLQHPSLNGIDYLEVCTDDDDSSGDCGCGKRLQLTLLRDARNTTLTPSQIQITGGAADGQIQVVSISPGTVISPNVIGIELNQSGDFSPYTLRLLANPQTTDPPDGFDPQLSCVTFSFKAGCPTVGDCAPDNCCPPPANTPPDINYLAKDYGGFRQVMLDRIAVLSPGWTETHAADAGVALVETLAYVADHYSYQQDAVSTEAYLGTARSRISLRRHAKLVDYKLNEGCNARAWVFLKTTVDAFKVPQNTRIFPRIPGLPPMVQPKTQFESTLKNATAPAFSTMACAMLHAAHNQLNFYTWGDTNCCLPAGSTQATLEGIFPNLAAGMVLIFEEIIGPNTGNAADADPAKRWAVRLTNVRAQDYKSQPLSDPLNGKSIVQITWSVDDALPFPLCISSTSDQSVPLDNVSVARGNIVPVDQGVWLTDWEILETVPDAASTAPAQSTCTCNDTGPVDPPLPRYYPKLNQSPLTFARSYDSSAPASAFITPPASATPVLPIPEICVRDDTGKTWDRLDDLLSSDESDTVYVVEIEHDGSVFLRFGDNQYGAAPAAKSSFQAYYRTGNGTVGNVSRETLAHILISAENSGTQTPITEVRNPLPAGGGVDPETMEHIRQVAPFAFRSQLRAVTEDDYGTMAMHDPAIQQARGTFRWTGSWYTAFVSLEPLSDNLSTSLVKSTETRLNLLRMIGTDLAVEGAILVGLRIELEICVQADHFAADVQAAVQHLLITGNLCNGQPGLLNRNNFSFGQRIYTSPLIAAVQQVPGVASVTLLLLQRMDDPWIDGAAQGFLQMGRLEIARCDNDPNRLDRGILKLHMDGGK
ncbi:MAG TPA: putative baseplate assembly protein [Tepidisphaeraceae bacterium]|jgi:hypothetical protein|nr:putative baseplate assembly protein [Tepidisphaeraceae bacterium]